MIFRKHIVAGTLLAPSPPPLCLLTPASSGARRSPGLRARSAIDPRAERPDRQGHRPRARGHPGRQGARSARRDLHPEHAPRPGPAPGPRVRPALPRAASTSARSSTTPPTRKNPAKAENNGKWASSSTRSAAVTGLGDSLHLQFHESGFVQMLLMDSNSFNRQTYNFTFVRNDFLGSIPTAVFDVTPIGGRSIIPAATRSRPLLRPHLGRDPERQRRPLQRRLRRQREGLPRVLSLR